MNFSNRPTFTDADAFRLIRENNLNLAELTQILPAVEPRLKRTKIESWHRGKNVSAKNRQLVLGAIRKMVRLLERMELSGLSNSGQKQNA